jgi:type I site-specific restriction endonuclease
MSTGLTSSIYDGSDTSFRSYALKCAACIDYCYRATDGGSKPLPKDKAPILEPKSWYKERINQLKDELEKYETLKSNPERLKEAYENEKKLREDYLNDFDDMSLKRKELKKRYESMKDTVKSWHPGEEYNTLKSVMLEHLEKSIESDCAERKPAYMVLPPIDKWFDNGIEYLQESLDFNIKRYEEECKHVEEANKYLKGLYEELDKFEAKGKTPFEQKLYDLLLLPLSCNRGFGKTSREYLAKNYVKIYGSELLNAAKETLDSFKNHD